MPESSGVLGTSIERHCEMENGQCSLSDPRMVVGLDFGTTFSGFAFHHTLKPDKTIPFDYLKAGGEKPYCKTLTASFNEIQSHSTDNWSSKDRRVFKQDMKAARRPTFIASLRNVLDAGPHSARRSTKYIGVRYSEELNKYVSVIRPQRCDKKIWLGAYNTAEEAARAFDIGNLCCKKNLPLNFSDSPSMLKNIPSDLSPEDARSAIAKLAKDVAHQYHGKADGELQSPFQNHDPRRQDYGTNPVLQENRPFTGDWGSGPQAMDDECEVKPVHDTSLADLKAWQASISIVEENHQSYESTRHSEALAQFARWSRQSYKSSLADLKALQASISIVEENHQSYESTRYSEALTRFARLSRQSYKSTRYSEAPARFARLSRQDYEEKDYNGGTEPNVQENWLFTGDGDSGFQAMDDECEVKPVHDTILASESEVKELEPRFQLLHELEEEIENSKAHWSVVDSKSHAELEWTAVENRKYFDEVKHEKWGAFSYKLEVGEKIGEGGHAEIFESTSHRLLRHPEELNLESCSELRNLSLARLSRTPSHTPQQLKLPRHLEGLNLQSSARQWVFSTVDDYAMPCYEPRFKPDVYSYGMLCYEIMTGKSPFGTEQLHCTRKSSGRTRQDLPTSPRTWSTEDIGALLKTCLLAPKQDAGPDWGNVSELLLREYGIDRASTSCKILWGSLQRCYNAIRNYEMMIYNGTTNGPSYFEMDEEERSKNMLPPVFDLEWCQRMETILKAKSVEVQSGTTADECTGLSNCVEVLCADDEEDESCESAVSEVEDSTADSYVPQTEPTTDKEGIDASATLRNLVKDMVRPLITALQTRVEEEQKHRQKVLTAEMDKVALMLEDIRRVLAHSNETRGKDLPELPSQQISVASGGKRKADMKVHRQAKK